MSAESNSAFRMQEYVRELERAGMHVDRADEKRWVLSGQCGGVAFEYRIGPAFGFSSTGQWSFTLGVQTCAPGEFRVQPQGLGAAIARFFGMAREFRTGDRAIDGAYDFSATSDEYAK